MSYPAYNNERIARVAVINGDIVASTQQAKPSDYLVPLKAVLSQCTPHDFDWDIYRGDSFQLRIGAYTEVLRTALYVRAALRAIDLDVRMALSVGEEVYQADMVAEANGPVYHSAGRVLDQLQKRTMGLVTFNEDINDWMAVALDLASISINGWSTKTAAIIAKALEHPEYRQADLAKAFETSQSNISAHLKRGAYDELMLLNDTFVRKLAAL